ncbi:hypothetical protein [Desulfitobacterium sp.]|uniref:hypothetical protein n=1 Tax=Desulfitobacterium sp. TaxID=49981 RepID=UPI002B20D15F|nr:hypothetical protein [Desulfitobacterium sp.]MEA4901122.1 hypothetical protein [Desulfitobacterium sp.]
MNHIYEVSSTRLEKVTEELSLDWQNIYGLSLVSVIGDEREYWDHVNRNGRIYYYRDDDDSIAVLISLTKKEAAVTIDLLYIKPKSYDQDLGMLMLNFAERVALKWNAYSIKYMFSEKSGSEPLLPKFQKLGYSCLCPIELKGTVLCTKML